MEDLIKRSNAWRVALSVVLLVTLVGCGPSRKQADSEALREASSQARKQYHQAEALIANPPLDDSTETVGSPRGREAVELLDQARQTLQQALQEHYTARKGSAKPEELAIEAAAGAKLTLGLVGQMRGQYHLWKAGMAFGQGRQAMEDISRQLKALHDQDRHVQSLLVKLESSQQSLQDELSNARSGLETASQTRQTTSAKIEKNKKELQQLEQTIARKNEQASKLKTEATLATGQESLQKLEQSLAAQNEVYQAQVRAKQLADEQQRLTNTLQQAESKKESAEEEMKALEKIKADRLADAAKGSEGLKTARAQRAETIEKLRTSLSSLGSACQEGGGFCQEAITSVTRAEQDFAEARDLAPDNQQAVVLAESGDAQALLGEVHLEQWYLRERIISTDQRIARVWQTLNDPPTRPSAPQALAFVQANADASQQATEAYSLAVERYDEAVRAADRADRWTYQRSLAVGYVNYAKALDAAGLTAEANTARQDARNLLPDIRDAAQAAGKADQVAPLEDMLGSAGG